MGPPATNFVGRKSSLDQNNYTESTHGCPSPVFDLAQYKLLLSLLIIQKYIRLLPLTKEGLHEKHTSIYPGNHSIWNRCFIHYQ
jgi:hypothetical protein